MTDDADLGFYLTEVIPPSPPIIIDMSDKTIAEIVKEALRSHDDDEDEDHQHHDHRRPADQTFTLPLHRLAFLLNVSDAPDLKSMLAYVVLPRIFSLSLRCGSTGTRMLT